MSRLKDVWHSLLGKSDAQRENHEKPSQDEKIGNVSLNAGDHGTIFGFNRNMIIGTGIAIFTITAIATIFAMDADESDLAQKRVSERPQQASTAQDGKHEAGKIKADSYADLAKSEANFLGQGNTQTGRGNGTPTAQRQEARPQQTPPSAPPVLQTVPAPVPLPAAPSEEDKEQQEYRQRMQSAIAFTFTGSAALRQQGGQHGGASPMEEGDGSAVQNAQTERSSGSSLTSAPAGHIANGVPSYTAPGKYTLQAGTIIPVVLCTGINSDIGGQVAVQVQQNMYDTATGRNLLIPAGSKILGTYGKGSPNSSGRIEITFSAIVLPDGGSYAVNGALVAVDGAGYSGISGKIDRHTDSILSAGMFSSALAALGSAAAGNVSNTANTYSAGQLAMQGAMANMMNTASSLFQQGANKQMTVTAQPGTMFSVYVTQGLTLQRGGGR